MSGNKTHQQQRAIIEKRVDTSNADKDFDPRPYLKAQEAGLDPAARTGTPVRGQDDDSDLTLRGDDQESSHHKNTGRPADQAEDRTADQADE